MTTLNPTTMVRPCPRCHRHPHAAGRRRVVASSTTPGRLRLDTGLYGPHDALRDSAADTLLAPGEGLAGAAVASGRPRVYSPTFPPWLSPDRAHAASLGDLTAAAALPRFHGGKITSVLVLFFRGDADACGAVELWSGGAGPF